MHLEYPFIYISGLPRTGTTLLSEALTYLPLSFIFRDPHLGKNYLAIKEDDFERLALHGVEINQFRRFRLIYAFMMRRLRRFGYRQDYMVRAFKHELIPQLGNLAKQIGVRETSNLGWENYIKHFPELKVLMLGRDPRDIYISITQFVKRNHSRWLVEYNPQTIAGLIKKQFTMQVALSEKADTMRISYESLCTNSHLLGEIKHFVRSPIPDTSNIGQFVGSHPTRYIENELHGGSITTKRVGRWKQETDEPLLSDAFSCFYLLPEYCEYWGYQEN